MRSSEWKRGFQDFGLITLNLPDLEGSNVKVYYLYCSDKNLPSLWDAMSSARAYKKISSIRNKAAFQLLHHV